MAYFVHDFAGIKRADDVGDGTSITLEWFTPYPTIPTNKVAIHIYFSENRDTLYFEGVKYVYFGTDTSVTLSGFTPGELMYFAIRAFEYNPTTLDFTTFPVVQPNVTYIPQSLLASNITATALAIPLVDASEFPATGIILIGSELIHYETKTGNTLNCASLNDRGYQNTVPRPHSVDGTDTSLTFLFYRQGASLYLGPDETNYDKDVMVEIRYDYPNFPGNATGYSQVTEDIVDVDLSNSDAMNIGFPMYDYAGYHRQDPNMLIKGECLGTYQGGEMYCQDDDNGVGRVIRGVSLQDRNNQRQEMLLRSTGVPTALLQRQMTGIRCKCMILHQEAPGAMCEICVGTGFVHGWVQYFNPRNSDGRLLIRYSPYDDLVKQDEGGFDPEISTDCWSLTVPTIKPRDLLVKYDKYTDQEEFRYEVTGVTRNNTMIGLEGMQKLKIVRVRKTDHVYKIKVFGDTATMPQWLNLGPMAPVPGGVLPTNLANHLHQIRKNESNSMNWIQNSTVSAGHNHEILVLNGVLTVVPILNHTHSIAF